MGQVPRLVAWRTKRILGRSTYSINIIYYMSSRLTAYVCREDEFGANFGAPLFADDPEAIWDHDPTSEEEDRCDRWSSSRDIARYGIARTPYEDTHLGLTTQTNWWTGGHMYGWESRTREKGLHLYTSLEEKQAIPDVPIGKPSDPGTS